MIRKASFGTALSALLLILTAVSNGVVSVRAIAAPDLAIDDVRSPLFTYPEWHSIYVTVINQGTADAGRFNVSLDFYLEGVFQDLLTQKVTIAGLLQGSNETIVFRWEPSEYGYYTLLITVDCNNDIVESDETNNVLLVSELCTFIGDLNGDGVVDGIDFGIFAPNYGKTGLPLPPELPNPSDLDRDGDVDGADFGKFAPNYGRHI